MVTVSLEIVTRPEVTSIVSTIESSLTCLITILPAPATTSSLKSMTKFASTATALASSTGVKVSTVGAVVSPEGTSTKILSSPYSSREPLPLTSFPCQRRYKSLPSTIFNPEIVVERDSFCQPDSSETSGVVKSKAETSVYEESSVDQAKFNELARSSLLL